MPKFNPKNGRGTGRLFHSLAWGEGHQLTDVTRALMNKKLYGRNEASPLGTAQKAPGQLEHTTAFGLENGVRFALPLRDLFSVAIGA
jgi:hypothetical protein